MQMLVYVDTPVGLRCELRDLSFTGVGLDVELPCAQGAAVMFRLEEPDHGGLILPTSIALQARVVRVELGHTGLRFIEVDGEEPREVQELVAAKQRLILAARTTHHDPRSFRG